MIALPANDLSPNLLEFIAQQQELIARQQEQIAQQQEQIVQLQERDVQQQIRIEALEAEIARLKKLNPKPNIKPNTKPPDDDDPDSSPPDSDNNGKPEAFSDGARQFDVFDHAQCWLHAERPLDKVIPVNEQQANAQYWCLNWFWDIYRDLKAFKAAPSEEMANKIRQGFDSLVHTQTNCSGLQAALGSIEVVKKELLMVLDDPTLPLHNNLRTSAPLKKFIFPGGGQFETIFQIFSKAPVIPWFQYCTRFYIC